MNEKRLRKIKENDAEVRVRALVEEMKFVVSGISASALATCRGSHEAVGTAEDEQQAAHVWCQTARGRECPHEEVAHPRGNASRRGE